MASATPYRVERCAGVTTNIKKWKNNVNHNNNYNKDKTNKWNQTKLKQIEIKINEMTA